MVAARTGMESQRRLKRVEDSTKKRPFLAYRAVLGVEKRVKSGVYCY
jgi:hypothetical protein